MTMRCTSILRPVVMLMGVMAWSTVSVWARSSPAKTAAPPPHVYPFGAFPDPYTQTLQDQSPPRLYVDDVPWQQDGPAPTNTYLRGFTAGGLAWLQLVTPRGPNGASTWALRHVDGTTWEAWNAAALLLTAWRSDVYEVRVSLPPPASQTPPSFWIAWPTNAVRPDRHPPAGAVHGKIDAAIPFPIMRVWGHVWDAMQAGLLGSSGVSRAHVDVDGLRLPVAIDETGNFSLQTPILHRQNGVHALALYAADFAHKGLVCVDTEFVSEYGWLLVDAPPPNPSLWDLGFRFQYIDAADNTFSFDSDVPVLVAKPRLDAQGLLMLDARESTALGEFHWVIENLSAGTADARDGDTVHTEDLPPGFYRVSCTAQTYHRGEYVDLAARFCLVIPPRISLMAREAVGALHLRWVPEVVRRQWVWSLYASGHVFDEIGTSLYRHGPENLRTSFSIDGAGETVGVDAAGSFLTRRIMTYPFQPEMDMTLQVRPRDTNVMFTVDGLTETSLTIFPPWDAFYPQP
ncbi:MAG: hypothetical protein K8T26_16880 [Lentisphaerae bacterium]|nr:hypothetical protein [Lentisphaerota bacterium]